MWGRGVACGEYFCMPQAPAGCGEWGMGNGEWARARLFSTFAVKLGAVGYGLWVLRGALAQVNRSLRSETTRGECETPCKAAATNLFYAASGGERVKRAITT